MGDGSIARKDIDSGQDRFRPYPAYKDSCVEWLGEIPVHWEVHRSKLGYREIDKRSTDGQETRQLQKIFIGESVQPDIHAVSWPMWHVVQVHHL